MAKDSIKEAKHVITHIEEAVKQWMQDTYNRQIGVSVQLLYSKQGSSRLKPENRICRDAFGNKEYKSMCEASDAVMKHLCNKSKNHNAISYRCHRKLSNIVIPHYDTKITRVYWYIFLGQFALPPTEKCSNCRRQGDHDCLAYGHFLDEYGIIPLKIDDIKDFPQKHRQSVNEHIFSKPPSRLANHSILDITQIISCSKMAIRIFKKEFDRATNNPLIIKELKTFAEKYRNFPAKKKDKENKIKPEVALS